VVTFVTQTDSSMITHTHHLAIAPFTGGEAKRLTLAFDRSVRRRVSPRWPTPSILADDDGAEITCRPIAIAHRRRLTPPGCFPCPPRAALVVAYYSSLAGTKTEESRKIRRARQPRPKSFFRKVVTIVTGHHQDQRCPPLSNSTSPKPTTSTSKTGRHPRR